MSHIALKNILIKSLLLKLKLLFWENTPLDAIAKSNLKLVSKYCGVLVTNHVKSMKQLIYVLKIVLLWTGTTITMPFRPKMGLWREKILHIADPSSSSPLDCTKFPISLLFHHPFARILFFQQYNQKLKIYRTNRRHMKKNCKDQFI